MKVSIILAHPDPGSFNHAIAKKASITLERNGHDVVFHDLYLEGFDPVLTLEEIPKTALLVLQSRIIAKKSIMRME